MTPEEQKIIEDQKAAKKAEADKAAKQRLVERAAEFSKIPIVIVGDNSAFNIDGPGLGVGGRLTIGGHDIHTTRWEDRTIRGQIPEGVKGEVVLTSTDGIVRKGVYPSPPKGAAQPAAAQSAQSK